MTSVSSKQGIVLGMCFLFLPGVVDNSKFTSNYSLFLDVVTQLNVYVPVWKNVFAMYSLFL